MGHCQASCCETEGIKPAAGCSQSSPGFSRPSEETQPRCGVTLGGVMRPQGILVPRMRQAPDGCKEGGSQPTDSSVINRRVLLAPALPIDQGEKNEADVKKLLPTLDIGSHINAQAHLLPEAGATLERTLEAVRCSARLCQKSIFRKHGLTKSMGCKARMLQKRGFDTVWRFVRRGRAGSIRSQARNLPRAQRRGKRKHWSLVRC